jgi:nitrite reductase (NAD(P)H)
VHVCAANALQATGSEATVPSYADPKMKGVFVYRNIADLNKILDYSQQDGVKGGKVRSCLSA